MSSEISCPPRWATVRNPDRPTLGPRVGKVAALLGRPLMPWQQMVADVAFEVDPKTGRLAHDEIVATLPRQSGKTLLELAAFTHRGLATRQFGPYQRMVYTAQRRKDARKKWKEEFLTDYQAATGLRGKWKPRSGPGDEGFDYANGSSWGMEASTETTGHGSVLDLAFIDEAFAQVDGRLQQAFEPAMLTRKQPQLWVVSTMGWQDRMPYLWAKVERGRERCQSGEPSSVAYFEWSALDDADPLDPQTWRGCMPALGHTQTEDRIRSRLASAESVEDFCRAYLNQVKVKPLLGALSVFDEDEWSGCGWRGVPTERPTFAVSMTPDRALVTLTAAGQVDGKTQVEVVEAGRMGPWFVPRVAEITRPHKAQVVIHRGHAVGSLAPDLEAANVRLRPITTPEHVASCGAFYDLVMAGNLRYPAPQPELTDAVHRAGRKPTADAWKWTGEQIHPLIAASQAVWGALTKPAGGKGRVLVMD